MAGRGYAERLTLQDAAAATGNGVHMPVAGLSSVGLQITGTFVATVTFEVSINGADFVSLSMTPSAGGAAVTTATAPGLFQATNVPTPYAVFRARVSAFTSGTVTAVALGVAVAR
jgi:hypothetical protein